MYKQILIAVDNSDPSKKAALKGVELAKKDRARVIGIHVIDPKELNIMDVGSQTVKKLREKQRQKGEKALTYLKGLARDAGVKVETVLIEGVVDEEIIKLANKKNVDLILIGTHGRRGFSEIINPNTPEEAIKECPSCPIMVVV